VRHKGHTHTAAKVFISPSAQRPAEKIRALETQDKAGYNLILFVSPLNLQIWHEYCLEKIYIWGLTISSYPNGIPPLLRRTGSLSPPVRRFFYRKSRHRPLEYLDDHSFTITLNTTSDTYDASS